MSYILTIVIYSLSGEFPAVGLTETNQYFTQETCEQVGKTITDKFNSNPQWKIAASFKCERKS